MTRALIPRASVRTATPPALRPELFAAEPQPVSACHVEASVRGWISSDIVNYLRRWISLAGIVCSVYVLYRQGLLPYRIVSYRRVALLIPAQTSVSGLCRADAWSCRTDMCLCRTETCFCRTDAWFLPHGQLSLSHRHLSLPHSGSAAQPGTCLCSKMLFEETVR